VIGSSLPTVARYTVREVLAHSAGVAAIVIGIFLLRRFGSLLGDAAEATFPLGVVLHLLALRMIVALPSLLPVALYLGALLGFGRLYRDSEMTAFSACGLSPLQIHRGVVVFSLVAGAIVAVLSFGIRPWAANRLYDVQDNAVRSASVEDVVPGRFYELGEGDEQVLFAESRAQDDPAYIENVFVQQRRGEKVSIFVARRATEVRQGASGDRYLQLVDGYRYDIQPPAADSEITQFGELVLRTAQSAEADEPEEKARPSGELFTSEDPIDIAELQWRLAMPVSTVLLLLVAIPLGRVEPRAGRYGRFLLAIVIYVAYRQAMGTTKIWVEDQTIGPFPGVWVAHAACALCLVLLLAWEGDWGRQLWPRRNGATIEAGG
jgi:lipopolysaccharide export system permease protein